MLRDCSATLKAGELSVIIGPNGSGKSSLLKCLAGVIAPTLGEVTLVAADGAGPGDTHSARAYLPQETPTPFAFTPLELISLSGASRRVCAELLERFDLHDKADQALTKLSGGERQRAALVRALAQHRPFLLLDEPLVHLDPLYRARLWEWLIQAAHEGAGVALIVHELNELREQVDQVLVLHQGGVLAAGRPAAVLDDSLLQSVFKIVPRWGS